jgi:AbrB family looped-hinge helix DNA binding protein
MSTIQSKVTAQGQISVPASVRRRLGIGPGSVLEWEERDGEFIVRRGGRSNSADIHAAVFGTQRTVRKSPASTKAGVRKYIRRRHARD